MEQRAFNGIATTMAATLAAENTMTEHLNQAHLAYLERRKLDPEIATSLGLYSDKTNTNGEGVLVFPFKLEGRTVNHKYRSVGEKKFWQDQNATRCFWNAQVLEDPEIKRLIITEGEFDAMAAIQSGFPHTVSVPDGAVPEDAERADNKLAFMAECEAIWSIPEIVIATDNDGPGRTLAKELVRRLGAVRCLFLEWPANCKDLNEVLYRYGEEGIKKLINEAKQYPVKGLFKLSEYPDLPAPKTHSTGWRNLDEFFKPVQGTLCIVTGVPSAGKSKWTAALLKNILIRYQHKAALASFEMPVVPYLRNELRHQLEGANLNPNQKQEADKWIEDNFIFIDQDPREEEEEATLEWLIDRAKDAVIRYGIQWLLIDPWNQVDDNRKAGESTPEYQKRAIKSLKRFAKSYDVGVIIVAHPTKDIKLANGEIREPNLYDIDGSAHWYNAADHGLVIDRGLNESRIKVVVKKARFKGTGKPGEAWLNWCERDGEYIEIDQPMEA